MSAPQERALRPVDLDMSQFSSGCNGTATSARNRRVAREHRFARRPQLQRVDRRGVARPCQTIGFRRIAARPKPARLHDSRSAPTQCMLRTVRQVRDTRRLRAPTRPPTTSVLGVAIACVHVKRASRARTRRLPGSRRSGTSSRVLVSRSAKTQGEPRLSENIWSAKHVSQSTRWAIRWPGRYSFTIQLVQTPDHKTVTAQSVGKRPGQARHDILFNSLPAIVVSETVMLHASPQIGRPWRSVDPIEEPRLLLA